MAWTYPQIDPVALQLGPVAIHWYGIMYLIGFLGGWGLLCLRAKKNLSPGLSVQQVGDLVTYAALGVIIGGRLGYMLFYDLPTLIHHPLSLLTIWQGGMSFHGGFLGVALALWLFGRRHHIAFLALTDFLVPVVPIGLAAGRIGNFINGELWGRVSDVPWAIVFPTGGPLARHPSQLYEFLLEGVLLFFGLWCYSSKPRALGRISAWFAIGYSVARIFCEFFRMPDPQYGYLAFGWLTMGQLLCLPLLLLGVVLLIWSRQPKVDKAA